MTSKIKELAQQAGLIASEHDDLDFKKNLTDKEKKFAELIVKECMDQCFTDTDAENIAEHFGVEE